MTSFLGRCHLPEKRCHLPKKDVISPKKMSSPEKRCHLQVYSCSIFFRYSNGGQPITDLNCTLKFESVLNPQSYPMADTICSDAESSLQACLILISLMQSDTVLLLRMLKYLLKEEGVICTSSANSLSVICLA